MVHKIAKIPAVILLSLFAFFGCTQKEAGKPPQQELKIFTWSEYFDDATLKAFEQKTGAKVKADYFSSNEEMLAKLQLMSRGGGPGYDLILPSDYMVRTLIELKMLQTIDTNKLPFLKDFDPDAWKAEYDPGLKYSVPLAIGTTGVAINTKLLPQFSAEDSLKNGISWKEILENPAYQGKVTLLDDTKEVLQLLLLMQGKQMASATEKEVRDSFAYLKAHKSQLKGFPPETRPVIEANECAICMAYSGDALSVAKDKKEIRFVIPKEGASIWTDNFAIPLNAQNPALAYQFITEILSANGAAAFTKRTNYRTADLKARDQLPADLKNNRAVYPPAEDRARMHYLIQRKDLSAVIDREWALLKSQ
jgi:spermidine/putrescine transport system substrate-binding protein